MIKQNNILVGVIIGAILPMLTWIVFSYWKPDLVLMNRPLLPYLLTIAINLLLIRWSHRSQADKLSQGIMISTFIFTIALFLLKLKI